MVAVCLLTGYWRCRDVKALLELSKDWSVGVTRVFDGKGAELIEIVSCYNITAWIG